ncbi:MULTISPECIES: hypothetical protein [unclassified Peribacillus]|uniref:hypothetical protein n=1 Tax=unclassified Peribacillus TaxID=2675266 RepID=UPI0036715872
MIRQKWLNALQVKTGKPMATVFMPSLTRSKQIMNQYFRLRGTNLGANVSGETIDGEPLIDTKTENEDNETRFSKINKRNYKDLWFYSYQIFISVEDRKHDDKH